uniref:Uncharacterized protein n=1 Tax=Rhizophora mucronata TaxID=61149 RepID=A0A2P2NTM9_RHIMU
MFQFLCLLVLWVFVLLEFFYGCPFL